MTSAKWADVRLGDVLHIKHGFAFQGRFFGVSGKYIVVTPGNFYDKGGFKPKSGQEKFYMAEPLPEYILREGDLIVAMTEQVVGLIGSSALVPEDQRYLHNQRIGLVEISAPQSADKLFIYYLLNTAYVRAQLEATATGAKIRHTAPGRIEAVRVPLPPLTTQRRIAAILSAYDDLIENNTRRIRILEEMAQAIYREWFVEFRFPGHEGVRMVDSELGRIPEGWRVARLNDVATLDKGVSYNGVGLTDEGKPMANLKCFRPEGGFRRSGTKPYSGEYKQKHVVAAGDITIANTDLTQEGRVIGAPAVVPGKGFRDGGLITHHLFAVRRLRDTPTAFIFHLLSDTPFRSYARSRASGTTVLGLRSEDALSYRFVLPSSQELTTFAALVTPAMELAERLEDANQLLVETRDLLLPRLISGDIDVSDLDTGDAEPAA